MLPPLLFVLCGTAAAEKPAVRPRSVAVFDFATETGFDEGWGRQAADALAAALIESGRYRVATRAALRRECRALQLPTQLGPTEARRVADSMGVDRVITGRILIGWKLKPARARAQLGCVVADVRLGCAVGGNVTPIVETRADQQGALQDTGYLAVRAIDQAGRMLAESLAESTQPVAKVQVMDVHGDVHLDGGIEAGLRKGQRLLVMRSVFDAVSGASKPKKVGEVRVFEVHSTDAVASPVGERIEARPLDSVIPVYEEPARWPTQVVQR